MIKVKPAKAAVRVRKPDGQYLDDKGEAVPRTAYWIRRLADGDVVELNTGTRQTKK